MGGLTRIYCIRMYVHKYVYILHVLVIRTYVHTVRTYAYSSACPFIFSCIRMYYVYVHVCSYVRMYSYICIYMCIRKCLPLHLPIHIYLVRICACCCIYMCRLEAHSTKSSLDLRGSDSKPWYDDRPPFTVYLKHNAFW